MRPRAADPQSRTQCSKGAVHTGATCHPPRRSLPTPDSLNESPQIKRARLRPPKVPRPAPLLPPLTIRSTEWNSSTTRPWRAAETVAKGMWGPPYPRRASAVTIAAGNERIFEINRQPCLTLCSFGSLVQTVGLEFRKLHDYCAYRRRSGLWDLHSPQPMAVSLTFQVAACWRACKMTGSPLSG